jgi:hypothetical protein
MAGACDISYACLFYGFRNGLTPVRVLQSVASGLLGPASFQGGLATAGLGLLLHFFIAISAAAIFFALSRRLTFLVRHAIVSGIAYGAAIYAFMNFVVLPLSAVPFRPSFPPVVLITGLLVHMFGIGLPIALFARKA